MWLYQGQVFDTIPEHIIGFVYCITNTTDNRFYIGKKLFSKAARKQTKGKIKKIRKESDWKTYYGSNEELQKDVLRLGEEHFIREILYLCKTRGTCNYLELREQCDRRCLERLDCYNAQVRARVHRSHLKELRPTS